MKNNFILVMINAKKYIDSLYRTSIIIGNLLVEIMKLKKGRFLGKHK